MLGKKLGQEAPFCEPTRQKEHELEMAESAAALEEAEEHDELEHEDADELGAGEELEDAELLEDAEEPEVADEISASADDAIAFPAVDKKAGQTHEVSASFSLPVDYHSGTTSGEATLNPIIW